MERSEIRDGRAGVLPALRFAPCGLRGTGAGDRVIGARHRRCLRDRGAVRRAVVRAAATVAKAKGV